MLKIIVITVLLLTFSMNVFASDFVHPLDFKGTNKEKRKVVEYIIKNVKKTYGAIGMDDPSTLRMMEKKEIDLFKKLARVKDRKLLDRIITTYCGIGMCNYTTIFMMYNKELNASKESLTW